MTSKRILFWTSFLVITIGGGYYYWQQLPPQQVQTQLKRLEHPNATIASKAWKKLSQLFFTDWVAFYLILDEMHNTKDISFLIEKSEPRDYQGKKKKLFITNNRAIFYKADKVYCRTLGESLMAIAHNGPNIVSEFRGDWKEW